MLLRTIADNYGEVIFKDDSSPILEQVKVPDARHFTAAGPYGKLLFQEITCNDLSVWIRSFLVSHYTVFTCINALPSLHLVFQLSNSMQTYSTAFGHLDFHERAFNFCFAPSVHNKLSFRNAGLYTSFEIYIPLEKLQALEQQYPIFTNFLAKVEHQHPALLMKVNQVVNQVMLRDIEELLVNGPNTLPDFDNRCYTVFEKCLEQMVTQPRLKTARISMRELDQLYKAKLLLEENLHMPTCLDQLTEQISLSAYQLKKGFKQLFDVSPAEYLRNLRMEKALKLAKHTTQRIYEVAEQVGYTNYLSFGNAFKKYHHESAAKYFKGR